MNDQKRQSDVAEHNTVDTAGGSGEVHVEDTAVAAEHTSDTAAVPETENDTATKTHKTIMVVEDDVFISDIYDVKLSSSGYTIILANNGRDAIEKLKEGAKPQLILLDIIMPYMDGFDVLNALKENAAWKDIPVVLLTNLSQKSDIDRALELGAKDYLIKSHFTPSEVLSKVEKYIL